MKYVRRVAKKIVRRALASATVRKVLYALFAPVSFIVISLSGVFDFAWYKAQFVDPDRRISNRHNALMHYLLYGRRWGMTPSPFFIPEYFDQRNWRDSIVDPLTRYLLQKSNWKLATSPLFPGAEYTNANGLRSPLQRFLVKLGEQTVIELDSRMPDGNLRTATWGTLQSTLLNGMAVRQQQERLRASSRPVSSFDAGSEQDLIQLAKKVILPREAAGKPLVSIVTPAWNRESLIRDAMDSVMGQTFEGWEMLIVDDGSTDATRDIIREYQSRDQRIKLIERNHGGVCKARNAALENASGDWIAFLDSDNTWTPDFLQTMLVTMMDGDSEAAYSAIRMDNNGEVRYRTTMPNPKLLEVGNYIDLNALVVKKSILDKIGFFDENLRRMVDYDLVCRINKVTEFTYVPVIGVQYSDHNDQQRITTTELVSWDGVVKSKNFIDWKTKKKRDKKLISIILPVKDDIRSALRCLDSILRQSNDQNVELIIIDSSSTAAMNEVLNLVTLQDDRIRYIRQPASHDSTLGSNYGFAESNGDVVVFVDQRTIVEAGWLAPLLKTVAHHPGAIVGPVQLRHNRTVLSAGVLLEDDRFIPVNLLENHPTSDLDGMPESFDVHALMGGCFATNATAFRELEGLNPLYDKGFEVHDLSMRFRQAGRGVVIAKASRIVNLNEGRGIASSSHGTFYQQWKGKAELPKIAGWELAGFKVTGFKEQLIGASEFTKLVPTVALMKTSKSNQRRWAIKIAAPSDERRFAWGDMYFAEALAAALKRKGQVVAVDFLEAHNRPSSYLDDVIVNIRGLAKVEPQKGKHNILWVISHPDDVTAEEVKGYDKVYAAGKVWAEHMTEKSGVQVEFLPQCTDPDVFNVRPVDKEFKDKVLFVGNSRNVVRPIVRDAIAAGLDVAVYGAGWDGLIDKKYIKGTFIPNDKLAVAYGSAKIVLNDHWDDMREWGFLSNRLFDASAAGARIITDKVAGVETVFDKKTVRTYESVDDMQQIKRNKWSGKSLDRIDRERHYRRVKEFHSFDARAGVMLGNVAARFRTPRTRKK